MRIIGLDLGKKSLGIAITDESQIIVSPVENFRFAENNFQAAAEKLAEVVKKYGNVSEIVIGFPKNMDNSVGPRGKMCLKFKELIAKKIPNLEINFYDERLTTRMSNQVLINSGVKRKDRKKIKDKMSAIFILKDYLKFKSNK